MTEHLNLDALADVLAGEAVPDHLDGCGQCQTALSELSTAMASVTVALAQLPDPVAPDGLAARLEAAIAQEREAALPATVPAATITPLATRRTGPRRWLLPVSGIAAAAVLVGGGIMLTQGSRHQATSATSARQSDSSLARSSTGTDYGKDGKALAADLAGLLKGNAPTAPPVAAGVSTDRAALPPDPLATLRTTAGLASCLSSLTDPTDPGLPLALDYGSFEGKPALLVLLPGPKKGVVEAFFVGVGCSASDAKLLFFEKLPTP